MANIQPTNRIKNTFGKNPVYIGAIKGLPVLVGYLPIGFAYGVLAMQAGFTIFETVLMSILVYAGSAQFIGVGMIAAATGFTTIILTTFLINLRHLLMSASLTQYMTGQSKKKLSFFSYLITDESFAVNSSWLRNESNIHFNSLFAVNVTAYLGWISGSFLGALVGSQQIDVEKFGLDYALPAMFIILLIFQLENKKYLILALVAGVMSIFLSTILPHNLHIIITTILISTLGVIISRWKTVAA